MKGPKGALMRWGCRETGRFLGAEAFTARAACGGIRVVDFETAVLEGFDKIEFRSRYIERAFGIDDDTNARRFDHDIAIGGRILEVHLVLESGTASANNGDA